MSFFDNLKLGEKRSEESNKKIRSISLIIIAIVLIIGCYTSFLNSSGTTREDTLKVFNENREMFELVAKKGLETKQSIGKLQCEGCFKVQYYKTNHEMVQFYVSQTAGLSTFTKHKGMYYSPDDVPMAFMGMTFELVPDGNGWKWNYDGGCSYKYNGYTEKIDKCWYYYEATYKS